MTQQEFRDSYNNLFDDFNQDAKIFMTNHQSFLTLVNYDEEGDVDEDNSLNFYPLEAFLYEESGSLRHINVTAIELRDSGVYYNSKHTRIDVYARKIFNPETKKVENCEIPIYLEADDTAGTYANAQALILLSEILEDFDDNPDLLELCRYYE